MTDVRRAVETSVKESAGGQAPHPPLVQLWICVVDRLPVPFTSGQKVYLFHGKDQESGNGSWEDSNQKARTPAAPGFPL